MHDGAVHSRLGAGQSDIAAAGARDARLGAEDHQRAPDANLVAEFQRVAVVHAGAVDVAAVGAAHVVQNPVRRRRGEARHVAG